jgi:hypothetical protein
MPYDEDDSRENGGVMTYWGVADALAAYDHLISSGAREHSPVVDVGEGILLGTVLDQAGNIFGVIQNPHFSLESFS